MKRTIFAGILSLGLLAGSMISPVAAQEEAPVQKKEWTFLIFLNADNNLDSFGVGDVEEMEEVGSNDQFNMVVQLDRDHGKPCTRLFINKGSHDLLEDMGECDMGSKDVLTDFVAWGAENYPAKKYAVVIWNHGSGWNKKAANQVFKGISYDDSSGNHITTAQMGEAAKTMRETLGQKVDILAFDACLMQMAEVAYVMKEDINIMLASEDVEPGEGWAYNDSMAPIAANPGMSAEEVATIIVDTYDASYDGGSQGNRSTTQSWVKADKTDALVSALNEMSSQLAGNFIAETKEALDDVEKFYYRSNIDLIHFLELMSTGVANSANERNKSEVLSTLANAKAAAEAFVGHSAAHGYANKDAKGIAVYFPRRGYSYSQKYNNLKWAKETLWDELLQAYYEGSKTQEKDL